MSKQPRGAVRVTGGSNIFSDVKKFQRRYSEMKDRASTEDFKVRQTFCSWSSYPGVRRKFLHVEAGKTSWGFLTCGDDLTALRCNMQESAAQREARAAAMRGIRSVSYWWYRRSSSAAGSPESRRMLVAFTGKRVGTANNKKLQEAAAKRRAGVTTQPAGRTSPAHRTGEEYWTPALLPSALQNSATDASIPRRPAAHQVKSDRRRTTGGQPAGGLRLNPLMMRIPVLVAAIAAATVGVEGGDRTSAGIQQHFAGAAALEIVNSSWLQILLAGITWYLLAAAAVGLIVVLQSKED